MPDSRPLSSLRFGAYDEPPASSESSTPQTRRSRLRRALQSTNDLQAASEAMASRIHLPLPTTDTGQRRVYQIPSSRRRRRSESTHDEAEDVASDVAVVGEGRRHRYKRRRIEPSPPFETRSPIKYGYYGQVEPGRLKLDMISCDGGEHRDPRHPATSLGPENLLRHDKSVYCSERPYSNIILRHADDMPFCLEKLHVVGPEHGFTAPVREGIVYVAMTMGDLQKYTDLPPPHARRTGVDSPPFRRRRDRSRRVSPERLTLSDALRDPEVNAAFDDRDYSRDADSMNDLATNDTYYGSSFGFDRTDPEAHCEVPTSSDNPDMVLTDEDGNNRSVTFLSDEEPGPEETSSQDVLDYRLQRLRLARRRFEMETWDREDRWAGLSRLPRDIDFPSNTDRDRGENSGNSGLSRLDALMARSRVHDSLTPDPPEADNAPQDVSDRAAEVEWKDKDVTRTRFHIKRSKHKVAIKFDPPISGRFILVKLWAYKSNVDVQSVIAKGYGGCRFFPAKSVR